MDRRVGGALGHEVGIVDAIANLTARLGHWEKKEDKVRKIWRDWRCGLPLKLEVTQGGRPRLRVTMTTLAGEAVVCLVP